MPQPLALKRSGSKIWPVFEEIPEHLIQRECYGDLGLQYLQVHFGEFRSIDLPVSGFVC